MSTKKAPHGPKNPKKMSKAAKQRPERAQHGAPQMRREAFRPPHGHYFLWGHHALQAALANPRRKVKQLYATAEAEEALTTLIDELPATRQSALPVVKRIEKSRLDMIEAEGGKVIHQGMVAAVAPLDTPLLSDVLDDLDPDKPVRFMMLDQLSDPRNIGAILRSARAFGISALILQDRHAPDETGALARTSVGAIEDVPMIRVVNLARACEALKEAGFYLAGLDMGGNTSHERAATAERLTLIMGSEGKGLRRLTSEACDEIVAIRMAENSESLNVSVAAAIIMHQTQYQAS